MAIPGVTNNGSPLPGEQASGRNPFDSVDINDFLKLMIVELQNQDPLNPMDNAQILEQIGQMQSITSNNNLIETLESMALGQAINSASSMLSKYVVAMTDDGRQVGGQVYGVQIVEGMAKLQVGQDLVSMANVQAVLADNDAGEGGESTDTGGTETDG
jgi:flagellar basal-body rod modification protein FlgD